MIAVRVQYQVQEDYVEQNKSNIKAIMDDLRNDPIDGMNYSTYYLGDGKFMHLNVSHDQQTRDLLGQRASFQNFRSALKESGPLSPPESQELEIVGSSKDLI